MICEYCNTDTVIWKGPLINLTHTECTSCGRINCQRIEPEDSDEEPWHDEERENQMLKAKPNRADYRGENSHECYLIDDRDWHKDALAVAVEALEYYVRDDVCTRIAMAIHIGVARNALSTIKGSQA